MYNDIRPFCWYTIEKKFFSPPVPEGPTEKGLIVFSMIEQIINVDRMEQAVSLFGSFDENIRLVEQHYGVDIIARGTDLKVSGEPEKVAGAVRAINGLLQLINRGEQLGEQNVRYVLMLADEDSVDQLPQLSADSGICLTAKGHPVKPKTIGQKQYVEAIRHNTVVLGVGPAGTGKTYLAVAMAVSAFRAKEVNRIILTRPAVCSPRWIPTCGRCTTPCSTCWGRKPTRNIWNAATLRWRLWPTCAAGRWTTALSFWMRRRTPPPSK